MKYLIDQKEIGKRIRARRVDRAFRRKTLHDVAAAIGKTKPYISLIENGERLPTLQTLVDIANALDVHPFDLIAIKEHQS